MVNYTYATPLEAGFNVTQGADRYFAWIATLEPTFVNYFLIMVWAVIFMGGSFKESRVTSQEQYSKWGFIASLITFGLALVLNITNDFVAGYALAISFAVLVLFTIIEYKNMKVA